jgi:predicted TIM-barrel fold metal-dependent hydrolase
MASVPNSSGSAPPRLAVPAHACDAHMHVYDGRFATTGTHDIVERATVADYRLLQQRLGLQRTVIVTPRPYGTDNRVTLEAIAALGGGQARGVAVVTQEVSDAELRQLHDGGIRGIRFTLYQPVDAVTSFDMVEPLARRVRELG